MAAEGILRSLKRWKDGRLTWLARPLVNFGIGPSVASVVGLLCGVLSVVFLFRNVWLSFLLFSFTMFMDALDGAMARLVRQDMWVVDYVCDRIVFSLFVFKAALHYESAYFAFVGVLAVVAYLIMVFSRRRLVLLFWTWPMVLCVIFGLPFVGVTLLLVSIVINALIALGCLFSSNVRDWFSRIEPL